MFALFRLIGLYLNFSIEISKFNGIDLNKINEIVYQLDSGLYTVKNQIVFFSFHIIGMTLENCPRPMLCIRPCINYSSIEVNYF